ncbi:tail fiber domain-containing protein [Escherichia coli]
MLSVNGACHATAFNQHSDRDLKDNIQVIDNATDRIRKMNGYTYTLKRKRYALCWCHCTGSSGSNPRSCRFRNEISGRCKRIGR